jgi:hypothetical protein
MSSAVENLFGSLYLRCCRASQPDKHREARYQLPLARASSHLYAPSHAASWLSGCTSSLSSHASAAFGTRRSDASGTDGPFCLQIGAPSPHHLRRRHGDKRKPGEDPGL